MDFDANCALVAHFSTRAIDNLICDSPLGSGHIRINGNLPGQGSLPSFSIELERVSVAAALDALRSVRSGFASGLEAAGSASGKLSFAPPAPESAARRSWCAPSKPAPQKDHPAVAGPLTGSLTVTGLQFSGGGLNQPVVIPELVLTPVPALIDQPQALAAATCHSRRRGCSAGGLDAPCALRLPAHGARSGFDQPGQGTGARGRPGQCAFFGLSGRRPGCGGPDRRRPLDAAPAGNSNTASPASIGKQRRSCSGRHAYRNAGLSQRQLEGGVSGQFHPDLPSHASFGSQ